VGTKGFMAPEILDGQLYQGQAVDLFALAVTLFCMYTGFPPFDNAYKEDKLYKFFHLN
jgi:serine/threonine protein kinase